MNASKGIDRLGRLAQPILGLLILHLVLALIYGAVNPAFEAPDEDGHFLYAQAIAETGGIPRHPGTENLIAQQHPPLYYLLGALLIAPLDTSDLALYTVRNPYGRIGHSDNLGNKNLFLHPPLPQARFPWQGTALAVHLLRWLSTAFGAGTVWLTYAAARRIFYAERWAPMLAAGLVAFNPQFIFISASVSNDAAVTFFVTLACFLAIQLADGQASWPTALLAGAAAGLAALSKLSGVAVLGVVVLGAFIGWWEQRSWRRLLGYLALAGLAWALVTGWWLMRNQLLYGDPWGAAEFHRVVGPVQPLPVAEYIGILRGVEISYWAAFGWLNILVPEPVYWFYKFISRLGMLGLLVAALRAVVGGWRPPIRWRGLGLALVWVATWLVGSYWLTRTVGGLQGRLLFPAIGGAAILVAAGWRALWPDAWRRPATAGLLLVLAGLAVAVPFLVIQPAFGAPPAVTEDDIPAPARFDQPLVYGERVELLGVALEPSVVRPGAVLYVTAYWRALTPVEGDYSLAVRLYGPDEILLGQTDTYPGLGNLPTSQWQPGQIYRDTIPVNIAWEAPAPSTGYLSIEWYKFGIQGFSVPPMRGDQQFRLPLASVEIAPGRP